MRLFEILLCHSLFLRP